MRIQQYRPLVENDKTNVTRLGNDTSGRKRKQRVKEKTEARVKVCDTAVTMVGERRNGNLLVQLGPKLQAYPEELIRQRRNHDGQTEYLIRWCLVTIDDGSSSGGGASEAGGTGGGSSGVGGSSGSTSGESKPENILMWMSTEDVYANCPTLLGKRKTDTQRPLQQQEKQLDGESSGGGQRSGSEFPSDVTFDEVELSDMKEDVKNLVCRARKQMAKKSDFSISITHTIHVLSAYASIGSLVGVFKETGALNLLMELLCNKETQTRRSAGKMLRALASHDAGSRAYVLLSLSQQDGIEQHMDFDNRYTLLELFAETTSSEEHGISFEGIHLPQIPGKLLFSLVKRYLCVTSLMDKLNTAGVESNSDRQDASPSPASSSSTAHQTEHLRVQREFDFTMAMANLISELVRVMGWDRNRQPLDGSIHRSGGGGVSGEEQGEEARPILRSIFQPRFCASPVVLTSSSAVAAPAASQHKKKPGNGYKTRSEFASRSAYVEYVQDNLKSGMMVRMLEDYEEASCGDEGEFRYSNDGSPPVQVYWNSLSRTYWVHWHMVEILGSSSSSQSEKETQEKASTLTETLKLTTVSQTFFSKPPGGLYSLPYLSEGLQMESLALSRAEWWEILFFIKKLEPKQQQEVNSILLQSLDDQEAELDDWSLIGLSVHGDVAKKLLHYLKQKLPSSCLSDLLCSHTFCKHYLRRGGGILEDEELLAESSLGSSGLGGVGGQNSSSSSSASVSSSSAMGSVSKKAKKEIPADSGCGSPEAESELPSEDDSRYPEDLEDKMKVFNNPRVQGKKTMLEKLGEVVDILKKGGSGSDQAQQLAAVLFITRLLEEKGGQEKNSMRSDSAQTVRDKVLKLLVELLSSSSKDLVISTLRLTHLIMLKYEWRVSFASEGGVKAVLSCMQEFSTVTQVQQLALATLKVITGASKHDLRSVGSSLPLSESGTQMMLEIFASIGSATPEGSKGLLGAIPAAIDLMLKTKGCMLSVRNGLLVIIMLISNHKSLAEQLVASDVTAVLNKCLTLSRAETMLAIIALNHISMVHKLDSKECREQLDFKDTELQMLVVSLKELTATKEVIQTLEQLLCDDASQLLCDDASKLEEKRSQVTHSRETYQDLVRLMEQHRADRAVQVSILRILNKFLDNYEEDVLPWHESIEPCLSSMTAFISEREVVQHFIRFLYRLASLNKDYAVVMCRLGTKEALVKALDKHSTNLLLVTELRDLITDCEKYASLYKKMTTSVLAGCIQMVLGQIEEHRRSHQPINIPFFDVFLRNLCQGSSVELKEDKCWEKVEVSSNHHRANKLTDKNPKTYWESNGCTGSHFINIYMHKGVVIRQLAILVASEDSSYMPARILVLGGDEPTSINTELNTVNVTPSASRVVLLENMTRFWSIIQIRVKRCQQGGIDTRVHGFEVLGPKPTFWPVFKEQLCCRTYLFYSTKAHTWCQEVMEDKTQLLQLFNKLNSALRHEQMFADRFLPDAEAAEALGRTCWEALITPIVHSITLSESATSSPLSWLLSEYLDNAESARRCKSRAAIFNSRVRRLTHLLVHVDTSQVDDEELKPPVKSNGKEGKNKDNTAASSSSSSSSAKPKVKNNSSIAGIALCWQGVVQRQVKKFLESSCSLPDFVERYRTLYLRLRNAMEELFGQQTAFVLALRHGFSAALLQLSILKAMHVSERFAQYIDQMIQASGAACGSVQTLERLQQFLEPMLFLSGLELANTFEHFYRYYLGDRLLAQGNVWLESAVIDQIGSCFPSRFPQQMMKNLSESSELQQEFHLYRLQQLDRCLQEHDQMMEEEWAETEEEAEVHVLVLSPRCWAVSSLCFLDQPAKHYPAELCSYLNQFTQFYTHSVSGQSMYGLSHSKPRRLQWTWLGHAELQFGCWTLHVSTLQMFILLQFNSHEEVQVEALLQATCLSAAVLLHALLPLISEGGPLICSHPNEPSQGVLRLNQEVASRSLESVPASVQLLPRQTYVNVDEDAAGMLERKRNYIYCLIVHIMKQEKEMHIDNLVFKVLDSCQKKEASRSPGSGRISCSTSDVFSCIMHVISKGCIRRNEDNPHIVEFLPEDPSTPQKGQAQFSFSRAEIRKDGVDSKADISLMSAPRQFEDGVLDAVLFSMGRTMTQEEVRQLMQRTVQQVSATLSLDLDCAEHLLVHCKWNMDLLVQRYTDDSDTLVMAAGLKCRNPQPPPSPASTCPVCLGPCTAAMEQVPSLSCMHYCCRSCWQEYLTARIEQNLVMNCNCPITDCQAQPTSVFFLNILTDKDTISKYENGLLRGYVECCSNLTWCTNPQGCDQILCKENMGSMGTCSKCCWSSCFSCNFPEAHYPASCSHMSQWMDDGGYYEGMSMEAQSKHLAKLISKRCPSCQAQIEKNEGCLHMTCAKCNHGFCWRCLKPWKPTHKDYYNCSAMVSKAARQEKKFQDYNERCTFHNQAKDFAINLENKVSSINEALQMKSLTFVIDACKVLAQARKVLAYSCVYSYYNQETEKMDVMEQQTEALDLHTNALQILLEETLLQCTDLASCVRLLKPEHLNTGLELIRRIQERLLAILQHSTQDFRVGYQSKSSQDPESTQASNLSNNTDANKVSKSDRASDSGDSDNNNNTGEGGGEEAEDEDDEYDEEYVPEWHEDYDEDDIDEDDFFSDDDESENLERDFSPFD
ncbi:cullin-9 isoform X4 [Labrus mixtus]|uniref:cullin-9 isoform X4 n=1 Tax=Labrus mixtus TaxID=508554 RepID=UPI0029C0577C|nr:cullin-9 isoform X4 [Labrus mixtus]